MARSNHRPAVGYQQVRPRTYDYLIANGYATAYAISTRYRKYVKMRNKMARRSRRVNSQRGN